LAILQLGWDQKKFSRAEVTIAAPKLSTQTANDCKLPKWRDLARLSKIPLLDFKQLMPEE